MIGDQGDIIARIKARLPSSWFSRAGAGVLEAIIASFATSKAYIHALVQFAGAQSRVATASGMFLDMASADYFGGELPRLSDEQDDAYRDRITLALLRERSTRKAVQGVVERSTGSSPIVVEPMSPEDTGFYGSAGMGYGSAGAYGSMLTPGQSFLTIRRNGASIEDICGAIERTRPATGTVWVRFID